VDEVAADIGADSLAYISLDGVYEAVGGTRETHCDACFTGDYPDGSGVDRAGLPLTQSDSPVGA
jgi:glutamine phosphoribosylpyrophosphate amidotransferase